MVIQLCHVQLKFAASAFMRNQQSVSHRKIPWGTLGYGAVLAVAYLAMLLFWDLYRNQGSIFQAVFSSSLGLGLLTTAVLIHAMLQVTYRQLSSAFNALLGTILCLALVMLCFSYVYAAEGVCNFQGTFFDCLYYSAAVMTTLNEGIGGKTLSTSIQLHSVWQVVLGIFLFLLLLVQMVNLTQEYKRLIQEAA